MKKLEGRDKILRDKRLACGCHEAAHAVVCIDRGLPFQKIIIWDVPQSRSIPNGFGKTLSVTSVASIVPTNELLYQKDALNEAANCLAGMVFEKLLRPRLSYISLIIGHCASDYTGALDWCAYHVSGIAFHEKGEIPAAWAKVAGELMDRQLIPAVRKIVVSRWRDIIAVGSALSERGELSQSQVKDIIAKKGEL